MAAQLHETELFEYMVFCRHSIRRLPAPPSCISGLVVEYVVAIDVTRVRFPADAFIFVFIFTSLCVAKIPMPGLEPGSLG